MDKTIKILGGLLAVQLLLALWAFSGGSDLAAQHPEERLLAFDPDAVSKIEIAGPENAAVTLTRTETGGWILPDAWQVPASKTKVEQLLGRLQGLKKGLAVATTPGAQRRFEVADDKFQRRITLFKDDEALPPLYLGTAPAMRRIHARTAGDEPVYTVPFSAYEAPVKVDDWLDSALVQAAETDLQIIEVTGLTLSRSKTDGDEAVWETSGLADGELLNQEKVQELARKITHLDLRKVLGTEPKPAYHQDTPVLELTLRFFGDQTVTWTFSKPEHGEDFVFKSTAHPWYFEVASWAAEPILELGARSVLVVSPEPTDTAIAPDAGETQQDSQVTE